ncbi:MAG TPA: hypothetical protein VFV81_09770, partial [Verrucomicrobiae bacterium]|nr:hypothetical protein [Verrucomicrobiae bacterium]
ATGFTASQAMARCGHLQIKIRSASQEKAATDILLQTAYAFSPGIEATALGVCTMALKGLGLENPAAARAWAEKILKSLASFHLDARLGIAAGPEPALLAAHAAAPVLVVENSTDFIATLPLAALEPPPEIAEILSRWGIRTAGEFLALDRNEIARRLGDGALKLFNRVSTRRPLRWVTPPETFAELMEFENEIETVAPLLFVLRRFVEQLSRRLEAVYLVVAEFHLRLGLASGDRYERLFKIPSPTGNVDTLFRMLQTHLETVRTDSPIVSLELAATPVKPETHQFGLFESTLRDPNQFAETLARLAALVGTENVGTPRLVSSHKPDSFRMGAPAFDSPATGTAQPKTSVSGLSLRRFRPPLPAQFEFRGDGPAVLRCKRFAGAVTERRGPFFSSGNWWDNDRWAREEWDVAMSDGSLLRIFRSDSGCFVEGIYD